MGNHNPLDPLGLRFLLDPFGLRKLVDPTGIGGLNEDGVLSPFNPKNPVRQAIADVYAQGRTPVAPGTDPKKLNPADRTPPLGPVVDHEGSVMLARAAKERKAAQPGETEWWWHSLHLDATNDKSNRQLSVIANVQMFGTGLGDPGVEAMIAIRDMKTGDAWKAKSGGQVSADKSATFSTDGWKISREEPSKNYPNGRMLMTLECDDLRADLVLDQGPALKWGDEGWFDGNPNGAIPMWATYKSRMQQVSGSVSLCTNGTWEKYDVTGSGEFDHQTLHNSLRDVGRNMDLTSVIPAMNEASSLVPKWNWYRADLNDGLCLMAWHLWNESTGRDNSIYGAIGDKDGNVLQIDPATMTFNAGPSRGTLGAPQTMELSFTVAQGTKSVKAGDYKLVFRIPPDIDWTVEYQMPMGLSQLADEASATVEIYRDGKRLKDGQGGQETIEIDIWTQLEEKGFKPHSPR